MRTVKKLRDYLEMIGDEDKVKEVVNVAAGIIMKIDENQTKSILLIQRSKEDHWPLHFEFPRGKCDQGANEPIIPCLKREVKEETGLDIEPIEFLGKFEYLADKGTRKSICYNYLCKMKDQNQKVVFKRTPGGIVEHQGYKWITQAGEAELLVHPDQKRFIQQVLSTDNSIVSQPENHFTKNNQIEESIGDEFVELKILLRDPDDQLFRLIDYIKSTANVGHSFEVVVDPDLSENKKSFGIDGDGSFFIKDIKKDGKKIKIDNDKIVEILKRL